MQESKFQIITSDAVTFDSVARCHHIVGDFNPDRHLHTVAQNSSLGTNNVHLTDTLGQNVASGQLEFPTLNAVQDSEFETLFSFDRVDIGGQHFGYRTSGDIRAGQSLQVTETATAPIVPGHPVGGIGPGTMIKTAGGVEPVEWLEDGVEVETLDHGYQPIRHVVRIQLDADLSQTLVWLQPGEMADACPIDPLFMTPTQRLLLRAPLADLYFGTPEVLVDAKAWIPPERISATPITSGITLTLLVFDTPQLICAENVWVSSFIPDIDAIQSLTPTLPWFELLKLRETFGSLQAPRPCLTASEARLLKQNLAPAPIGHRISA